MAQIFPKWMNLLPLVVCVGALPFAAVAVGVVGYYGSPKFTDVGYRPIQPIPYSHKLHAGEMGIDCRYCHAQVEVSAVASVPPAKVCMNCHSTVLRDSRALEPLRESVSKGIPIQWVRVHNIPDYAYFDHSVHFHAGVGCASCHGKVHEMEVVQQDQPLSMGWCIECHRDPDMHLRPIGEQTNMEWTPPADQADFAREVWKTRNLNPPEDCSACHR